MAKKTYNSADIVSESSPQDTEATSSDYRIITNMTTKSLMGLPVGDGTTISMAPGPFNVNKKHRSRPVLNKYIGSYLRRLEKEGKITIEPVTGE